MGDASKARRHDCLPASLAPRGLAREQAAEYMGISLGLFDECRRDGRVGPPKQINGRIVFDRRRLDWDFDKLPDAVIPQEGVNSPFD